MSDYISRTLKAYDSDPTKYEQSTSTMINRPELRALLELIPDKTGPVLDAGCAYGRDMAVLHDELGASVVGIDMSDGLLKRGHELHPDFTFQKMDVRQLDFPESTFAGIWCNAVLLHLNDDDIKRALREFYRVVMPGGAVCVSVKEGEGSEEINDKFSSNGARYYNYQTLDTTNNLLEGAGFKVTKSYILNEREQYGADKRDLNWVWSFAVKPG